MERRAAMGKRSIRIGEIVRKLTQGLSGRPTVRNSAFPPTSIIYGGREACLRCMIIIPADAHLEEVTTKYGQQLRVSGFTNKRCENCSVRRK